jgi:hypothetical protein
MSAEIITLKKDDGRNEEWHFPDGIMITMAVPKEEAPITVKHAIYCFSEIIHRIHRAME